MNKRWFSPVHWLKSQSSRMDAYELERLINRLAERVDSKILKSVFSDEMIRDGYFDDVRSAEWEKTADMQWVFRVTDTRIDVLDVLKLESPEDHAGYWIRLVEVDLADFTDEQITEEIAIHGYSSIESIRSLYGTDSIYIIAECIAENMKLDPIKENRYEDLEQVAAALYLERGIQTDWIESIAV